MQVTVPHVTIKVKIKNNSIHDYTYFSFFIYARVSLQIETQCQLCSTECCWLYLNIYSMSYVIWTFFLYAQCNYIKGLLDFRQPHLICLIFLAEWNMEFWHLVTSLYAALLFVLAIVNYLLLILKNVVTCRLYRTSCKQMHTWRESIRFGKSLHWHSWSDLI